MIILAALACFFALFALVMTLINLRCWQRAAPATGTPNAPPTDLVTICIPARNEERNITSIVRSLLAGTHTAIEVLVYDDGSTDSTPALISQLTAQDPRVRSAATTPLPDGWNGKQHACWRMSQQARGRWMLFTDADVRFAPTAIANTLATAQRLNVPMVSGFPREIVGSLSEAMTIPMIFFILLSYLPFPRMRSTIDPGASAGCGQFLFIRRDAYDACGGHEGFKSSMHDGIKLPRAVRRAGMRTDLIDVTHECECRMYHNIHEVWRGFGKNAFEGLGSVGLLLFITLVHLLAHVAPWATLAWLGIQYVREGPLPEHAGTLALLCAGAVVSALAQRIIILRRTAHPLWIAALHPVSVTFITVIQWWSYYLHLRGKREWKGRVASA